MVTSAPETGSPATTREPLGLPSEAIERIARNAGVEDANCARRVLRAYEYSTERRTREAQLIDAAVRSFERKPRHDFENGGLFDSAVLPCQRVRRLEGRRHRALS